MNFKRLTASFLKAGLCLFVVVASVAAAATLGYLLTHFPLLTFLGMVAVVFLCLWANFYRSL